MVKIIKMLSVAVIVLGFVFAFASCTQITPDEPSDDGIPNETPPHDAPSGIVVPEPKDYDRNVVYFNTVEYKRPDIEKAISDFEQVSLVINEARGTPEEELQLIKDLEKIYDEVTCAKVMSRVMLSKNLYDSYWIGEAAYIASLFPYFSAAVEDLLVCASSSVNKDYFEEHYFGEGKLTYTGMDIYPDEELVKLLAKEGEIEIEYSTLSPATVEIHYKGIQDDALSIMSFYDGGPDMPKIIEAYNLEYSKKALSLFVDLLMTRKLIALYYGADNYLELEIVQGDEDQSADGFSDFLDSVCDFTAPLYSLLNIGVFSDFFRTVTPEKTDRAEVVNTLFELYSKDSPAIHDIYSYMLQFGFYDIEEATRKRDEEQIFTEYFDSFNSPFLFTTLSENSADYGKIAKQMGEYIVYFINYGRQVSSEITEASSVGLSLITLSSLKSELGVNDYKYLFYYMMRDYLTDLLRSFFYAKLEREVYALDYYDISEAKVMEIAENNAFSVGMKIDPRSFVTDALISSPLYYRSQIIGRLAGIELYVNEVESGVGYERLLKLIDCDDMGASFAERMEYAGLDASCDTEKAKELLDRIYYYIVGAHYYNEFH